MHPGGGPVPASPAPLPARGCALVACLALLAACATASPQGGSFAARELAHREAQVRRGLAGARDPDAERELHALACRLLPERCATLRIYVVDHVAPQARAYGNGMLLVHGALFDRLDDEAELAFALAHELAHLDLGHFQVARRPGLELDADAWAMRRLAALQYRADAGITLLSRLARDGHLAEAVAQRRLVALRATE